MSRPLFACVCLFVGPWDYLALDPTFGSFTLLELISLVKVFRLEWNFFWCSECGVSRSMDDILSIARASVFVMSCLFVCLYVRIFLS
jgi:hypothetical protein